MRPIDADELKDHQFHGRYTNIHIASNTDAYMLGWNDAIDAIVECAPTIDAVPVKHGHWIAKNYAWHCSECGMNPTVGMGYIQRHDELFAYCPNCGSKMNESTMGQQNEVDE